MDLFPSISKMIAKVSEQGFLFRRDVGLLCHNVGMSRRFVVTTEHPIGFLL